MTIRHFLGRMRRAAGPTAWAQNSYAQEGEDLVVNRLFKGMEGGFYVDVGSHHPFRFSNTYLMYRKKWHGLCIDPLPGSAALFNRWRPRDTAIEMGVSMTQSNLNYFMFNEPALNTFDSEIARSRDGVSGYKIIEKRIVKTDSLSNIVSDNVLSENQKINLLSIDVEGFDLQVLKSNDWTRFKPSVVIVECLDSSLESLKEDPTVLFMLNLGYQIYAKTGQSVIFTDLL